MPNKRTFTYADIEKFYKEQWKNDEQHTCELKSVHFLPELSPPAWQVEYTITYNQLDITRHFTLLLVELKRHNGEPWLTLPYMEDIPTGFASVEEEDAEIERQFQAWKKEQKEQKDV